MILPLRSLWGRGEVAENRGDTKKVAHSLSAKKRVRQNMKHRARNRARKTALRAEVKTFMTTLGSGDMKKAEEALAKAVAVMDRVAVKGTIHKNQASRRRSR